MAPSNAVPFFSQALYLSATRLNFFVEPRDLCENMHSHPLAMTGNYGPIDEYAPQPLRFGIEAPVYIPARSSQSSGESLMQAAKAS